MNHDNGTVFRYDPHHNDNPSSSGLFFVGLMMLLFMPGWLFIAGLIYVMFLSLQL